MTVEQADKIDIISIDPTGQVILTVSDHLPWSDAVQHQLILQTKLNKYLAFIESGEILQSYPDSQGRGITIKVVFKYKPNDAGEQFMERAGDVVQSAGFTLRHEVLAEPHHL